MGSLLGTLATHASGSTNIEPCDEDEHYEFDFTAVY